MLIRCDRCGDKAFISKRRNITKHFTQLYCICTNADCAHSFVMNLEFDHTISPSALAPPEEARNHR